MCVQCQTKAHVIIVFTPNIVRQFMTQHLPNLLISSESIVPVGTNTELDGLPPVNVQTQQPRVFMGSKLRQQPDRELVRIHHMEDRVIVRQFREQGTSRIGV